MVGKHKAVSITLGLWKVSAGDVTLYAVDGDVWQQSDIRLKQAALHEDGRLGYAKIDFTVNYDDGEEYKGRYDLRYGDHAFTGLLARHMTTFQEWHAGRCADPAIGLAEYRKLLAREFYAAAVTEASRFLDEYEIGSDLTPWPREIPERAAIWEHPIYVTTPGGRRVLTQFVRLCEPHREKREGAGEVRFNPFRFDSDKKCDDCKSGDLIPGPGRLAKLLSLVG